MPLFIRPFSEEAKFSKYRIISTLTVLEEYSKFFSGILLLTLLMFQQKFYPTWIFFNSRSFLLFIDFLTFQHPTNFGKQQAKLHSTSIFPKTFYLQLKIAITDENSMTSVKVLKKEFLFLGRHSTFSVEKFNVSVNIDGV